MHTLNTIDVDVQDVPDPAMTAAIRRTVHDTLGHLAGAWQVRVSVSDGPGHWDLRIRGAFGHHVSPFWASSAVLTEQVERRLQAFLRGVIAPLATRQRRPTLVIRGVAADRSSVQLGRQPQQWEDPQEKAS